MKFVLSLIAVMLLFCTSILTGCGDGGSSVENVNLGFGGSAPVDGDGSISVTKGDAFTAIASIVYTGEGQVKGEWTIDGDVEKVTADLPPRGEVDEGDSEYATVPIVCQVPTDTTGLHTVSFRLTSPEKFDTSPIEYRVEATPPPANANEYSVSMRLGKGFCITTAESGVKGAEELALAITIENVKAQSATRVLVQGDAGKIYPPGGEIDTTEGQPFNWGSNIGGPWTLDNTDTLNIKAYLYEIDGGGFLDAVLEAHIGFTVSGSDDYIGAVNFDIGPSALSGAVAAPANASGISHTVPVSFTGAATETGETVYLLDFSNGQVGHFLLELIVKVVAN